MWLTKETLKEYGLDNMAYLQGPFTFEDPIKLIGVSVFKGATVGRHTYMNNGYIRENVTIGRYCSIGRNVSIGAGDHSVACFSTHPIAYRCRVKPAKNPPGRAPKHPDTRIGHDVWIGDNAVILSGVHIGTGAVIGANAVVTKDVAPYSIVGGAPARLIRDRFPSPLAARLLDSEWWSLPEAVISAVDPNDIEACIDHFAEAKAAGNVLADSFVTIGSS